MCAFGGAKSKTGDLVDVYRSGARAKLEEAVRQLSAQTERRVERIMLEGQPAKAILDHAFRTRNDLIALSGHERSLVDRILLGSVRTQVVRGAKCSVLIAPPQPDERRLSHL